jgi:hypothetical protein
MVLPHRQGSLEQPFLCMRRRLSQVSHPRHCARRSAYLLSNACSQQVHATANRPFSPPCLALISVWSSERTLTSGAAARTASLAGAVACDGQFLCVDPRSPTRPCVEGSRRRRTVVTTSPFAALKVTAGSTIFWLVTREKYYSDKKTSWKIRIIRQAFGWKAMAEINVCWFVVREKHCSLAEKIHLIRQVKETTINQMTCHF